MVAHQTMPVNSKELQEKNGGSPVYKAHPGLKCVTITDHASGKWFFNQPDTVLDRQVRKARERARATSCSEKHRKACVFASP